MSHEEKLSVLLVGASSERFRTFQAALDQKLFHAIRVDSFTEALSEIRRQDFTMLLISEKVGEDQHALAEFSRRLNEIINHDDAPNTVSRSRLFLDSLVEHIPNMIFVKDADDLRFVRFNKAGEELLGLPRTTLIGKNDYDFFPKDQADHFTAKDRKVLSSGELEDIPEELIDTKYGQRILHTKKIPLFDQSGKAAYLVGISEDITNSKRAEKERVKLAREQLARAEAERALAQLQALTEAMPQLAWAANPAGEIEFFNSRWYHYTGLNADAPKESLLERAMHADQVAAFRERWATTLREHTVFEMELQLQAADQSYRWHLTRAAPVFADGNGLERWYGSCTDIEDQKRSQAMLEKAIRVRDEFLSIASHELKTPLTSLKLQYHIIGRQLPTLGAVAGPETRLQRSFEICRQQVDRLAELVEDLLDVSRIDSGKFSIKLERVDLAKLVSEVVERIREQAESSGSQLSVHASGPVFASCDRFRIEQVLVNLLTNAMKYGARAPVSVEVGGGEGSGHVYVEVRDRGIGIEPSLQEKIFERFERAVSARGITGMGLGLYIARQIVQAHGGRIEVESELARGSLFRMILPEGGGKIFAEPAGL